MTAVTQFYDDLSEVYRYIFPDWRISAKRQGGILHKLLEKLGFAPPQSMLDCTCGIGTQTFGLAEQGWRIHATDLSPKAVFMAEKYSSEFEMPIAPSFAVADLLKPAENPKQYDVVIAMDNAVSHFMDDDDLLRAIQTMAEQIKAEGLLMISIRDYDATVQNPPNSILPSVSDVGEGRHIIFQTWDWAEDLSSYKVNMYVTQHLGETIRTQCFPSELRAMRRADLTSAIEQIGLKDIQWHMPSESGYYQPIVTARK